MYLGSCGVVMLIKMALTVMILIFTGYGLLPLIAAHYAYRKFKDYEDIAAIEKAVALHPHGPYLYVASEYYSRKGRLFEALRHMEEAVSQYDGEGRIWHFLNGYGALKFRAGSLFEAQKIFQESLFFMPYVKDNPQAIEGLQNIEKIIAQHRRVQPNA